MGFNKKWIDITTEKRDYKSFVGKSEDYDLIGKQVFKVLLDEGLYSDDYLLDIGCGSLRLAKYAIPYLETLKYTGVEPNKWLVEEAIKNEISEDIINNKQPTFLYNGDFHFPEMVYNFIIANSIFIHASVSQIRECIENVTKVMNKNSTFIFNFMMGMRDNKDTEWTYPSHVFYTMKTIDKIMNENNLLYVVMGDVEYAGQQTWIKAVKKC